jgi:hypothetical protein
MCVLATGGGSGLNCLRGVEVFQRGCITYYGGPGAFSPRTFLKFEALKCPFPAFWALRLFVKFVFTVLVFRAKIKKSATLYGRTQHINLHDLHNCAWTVSGRISSFRKYITMAKCTAWLRYASIRDKNSIAWSEIQTSYYITLQIQCSYGRFSQTNKVLLTASNWADNMSTWKYNKGLSTALKYASPKIEKPNKYRFYDL